MKASTLLAAVALLLLATGNPAMGCATPPPTPPPSFWVVNHGDGTAWIGIEVGTFVIPDTTVRCSCGIQFTPSSPTGPLPGKLIGAKLAWTNKTDLSMRTVLEFDPEIPSGVPAGYLGAAIPVDPADWPGNVFPDGLPGEVLKLWFEVELPDGFNGTARVVTGSPDVDGHEPDDPFQPEDDSIKVHVPDASSTVWLLALSASGLFGGSRWLRRSRRG